MTDTLALRIAQWVDGQNNGVDQLLKRVLENKDFQMEICLLVEKHQAAILDTLKKHIQTKKSVDLAMIETMRTYEISPNFEVQDKDSTRSIMDIATGMKTNQGKFIRNALMDLGVDVNLRCSTATMGSIALSTMWTPIPL